MKNIGQNIKQIRESKQIKQQELSLKCGISANYLSQIESSRKNPSSKTIKKLSKELGVSPSAILEDTPFLNELRSLINRSSIDEIIENLELIRNEVNKNS